MNAQFWNAQKDWPDDPPGYVFMARAFDQIARKMFGDEWTKSQTVPTLSPDEDEDADDISSDVEHTRALVSKEIARLCATGELRTELRSKRGGKMIAVEPELWNGEPKYYGYRFDRWEMSLENPFPEDENIGPGARWIFMTQESLEQYCDGDAHSTSNESNREHLSPYMRVLLSVAAEMEISPKNQYTKKLVEDKILEKWSSRLKPLSPSLLGHMATILREPESQLGRASKLKK